MSISHGNKTRESNAAKDHTEINDRRETENKNKTATNDMSITYANSSEKREYKIKPKHIFQIFKTTTLKMDPLDTVGQDAHLMTEASKVAETEGMKKADEDREVVLEKSLMDEIADTLITEVADIEGSEQLGDYDDGTSEEEDNIPPTNTELNDASSRGRKKSMLVIYLQKKWFV